MIGKQVKTDNLITTAEAAEIMGVVPSRVRQLVQAGEIPALRIGQNWVLKRSDVKAYKRKPRGWPKGKPRKEV